MRRGNVGRDRRPGSLRRHQCGRQHSRQHWPGTDIALGWAGPVEHSSLRATEVTQRLINVVTDNVFFTQVTCTYVSRVRTALV